MLTMSDLADLPVPVRPVRERSTCVYLYLECSTWSWFRVLPSGVSNVLVAWEWCSST